MPRILLRAPKRSTGGRRWSKGGRACCRTCWFLDDSLCWVKWDRFAVRASRIVVVVCWDVSEFRPPHDLRSCSDGRCVSNSTVLSSSNPYFTLPPSHTFFKTLPLAFHTPHTTPHTHTHTHTHTHNTHTHTHTHAHTHTHTRRFHIPVQTRPSLCKPHWGIIENECRRDIFDFWGSQTRHPPLLPLHPPLLQTKMSHPKRVDFTLVVRKVPFKFGFPDPSLSLSPTLGQVGHLGR